MATELTMPQMGYDMQEGTVVRWLKPEGAPVEKGEVIAEIETDKAVVEFQSYADGLLRRILVAEGGTVPVGQTIAVVGEADEDISAATSALAPTAASGGSPDPAESNGAVPLPTSAASPADGPSEEVPA